MDRLKTKLAIAQRKANKEEAESIAAQTGRTATLLIESNMGTDDKDAFKAFNIVEEFAKGLGYTTGSMERDYPVACARNVSFISKWNNIDHSIYGDGPRIEAVIVGENKRNGTVSLYEFHKSE